MNDNSSESILIDSHHAIQRFLENGDEAAFSKFGAVDSALSNCGHSYPVRHRIQDVVVKGASYAVVRCVACGEKLSLVKSGSPAVESEGVPFWFSGKNLQRWVREQQEEESSAEDRQFWHVLSLEYRGSSGVNGLAKRMREIADASEQCAILASLSKIAEKETDCSGICEHILAGLANDNPEVRLASLEELCRIDAGSMIPEEFLVNALADAHSDGAKLLASCEFSKRSTASPGAIRQLNLCLNDSSEFVRFAAAQALWRIEGNEEKLVPVLCDVLNLLANAGEAAVFVIPQSTYIDAIESASEVGGKAWPAAKALRKIAAFSDPDLSGFAEAALRQIEKD